MLRQLKLFMPKPRQLAAVGCLVRLLYVNLI